MVGIAIDFCDSLSLSDGYLACTKGGDEETGGDSSFSEDAPARERDSVLPTIAAIDPFNCVH